MSAKMFKLAHQMRSMVKSAEIRWQLESGILRDDKDDKMDGLVRNDEFLRECCRVLPFLFFFSSSNFESSVSIEDTVTNISLQPRTGNTDVKKVRFGVQNSFSSLCNVYTACSIISVHSHVVFEANFFFCSILS